MLGTTHYIHNADDQIIAELDGADNKVREYIYMDDMPVAVVEGGTTLLWVHSDHLNRPVKMLNAAQTVVWEAIYEPFGTVASITGTATNDNRLPGQFFQLESGLAYNWHRHYDATIGRYTQADPLGLVPAIASVSTWKLKSEPSRPRADEALVNVKLKLETFKNLVDTELDGTTAASPTIAKGIHKDGPSTYNYARQSPLKHTDPSGLMSPGMFTPIPKVGADKCAANDNREGNWCFGTVLSIDSWGMVTCSYRCTNGMTFKNNWGTLIGGQARCPVMAGG